MPTHSLEDELYHKYDAIVSKTLMEIIKRSSDKKVIRLLGFNRKSKEHLFMLRIALMARDIYHLPIEIECSWIDRLIINRNIRKGFDKIGRAPVTTLGVWVPHVLDLVRAWAEEELGLWVGFDNIYNTYYEGSCG